MRRHVVPIRRGTTLATGRRTPPSAQALERIVAAYRNGRDLRALTKAILIENAALS
jgi:hypothetical protein